MCVVWFSSFCSNLKGGGGVSDRPKYTKNRGLTCAKFPKTALGMLVALLIFASTFNHFQSLSTTFNHFCPLSPIFIHFFGSLFWDIFWTHFKDTFWDTIILHFKDTYWDTFLGHILGHNCWVFVLVLVLKKVLDSFFAVGHFGVFKWSKKAEDAQRARGILKEVF